MDDARSAANADARNEQTGVQVRQVRKFNPGTLQSDGEVIDSFVVRRRELDIVLEVLRGNIGSASCQHVLAVAPRGRGKTMLLARAEAELRTNAALSTRLMPVRFTEENHEIATVADFWLETLFQLARAIARSRPDLAVDLRATHASLCGRWRERAIDGDARAAVLDAADRLGRQLVLMVENLQALANQADDDFGWQLRAALQSEPQIMLLASAVSRFRALDDAEQPFFELFRMVELKPLATDDCRRLWRTVSADSLRDREIRPLEILTGGSPRLLLIVAGFARHMSLRRLMQELVMLVDEHTEYFRGHLEALPKSERRVYVAVIDLWRPSTTGEIAERARMDVRIVSTMLGRLVDRGAVTTQPRGSGKGRLYTAAEALYSIYYKLRRERDEAAVVKNLIRFMVDFYDPPALSQTFGELWPEATGPLAETLLNRAYRCTKLGDHEGAIASYNQLIDLLGDDHDRRPDVALAAGLRNLRRAEVGRAQEALRGCERLEPMLDGLSEGRRSWVMWLWYAAQLMAGEPDDFDSGLTALGVAYDSLGGPAGIGPYGVMCLVAGLQHCGTPANQIADILSHDGLKASTIEPLIAALRQQEGETVRAPREVLEVAADVSKRIDEKIAKASRLPADRPGVS